MFGFVKWSMLMTSLSITLSCVTGALSGDQRVPTFESVTDKAILDHLLDTKRYDPRLRPDNHTVVNASIQLFSVASPDESSLNYEVEFLLHLEWRDRRLEFNDGGQHRYLKALTHANGIWVPDLYFIKHGELKQPLVDLSLKVLSDGTVIHITRRSMVINCQGNLKIFPFDNPKCPFAFESISHETSELELRWAESEPPLKKATSLQFHNAYLVKNATGVCSMKHTWRGNYSCLRVLLVFTRDKSFYFSTVFGPGMVLVTSSFISFWLDINVVPARVLIGVTTMLNFCTTTNNFRSKLPVVSNLTAMNLWDGVCMFFIYASLLEFVIGNYIHRKYPHLSRPTTEIQRKPSSVQSRRSRYLSGDSVPMHIVQPNSTGPTAPEAKSEVTSPEGDTQSGEHTLNAEAAKEKDSRQEPADTQSRSPRFPISFNTADCVVTLRRQAKSLDNVAKLVFPIIFGIFISCFFLTFAVIKPRQSENWDLIGEN